MRWAGVSSSSLNAGMFPAASVCRLTSGTWAESGAWATPPSTKGARGANSDGTPTDPGNLTVACSCSSRRGGAAPCPDRPDSAGPCSRSACRCRVPSGRARGSRRGRGRAPRSPARPRPAPRRGACRASGVGVMSLWPRRLWTTQSATPRAFNWRAKERRWAWRRCSGLPLASLARRLGFFSTLPVNGARKRRVHTRWVGSPHCGRSTRSRSSWMGRRRTLLPLVDVVTPWLRLRRTCTQGVGASSSTSCPRSATRSRPEPPSSGRKGRTWMAWHSPPLGSISAASSRRAPGPRGERAEPPPEREAQVNAGLSLRRNRGGGIRARRAAVEWPER